MIFLDCGDAPVANVLPLDLGDRLLLGQAHGEVGGGALKDIIRQRGVVPRLGGVDVNGAGGIGDQQGAAFLSSHAALPAEIHGAILAQGSAHGGAIVARAGQGRTAEEFQFGAVAFGLGGNLADGGGGAAEGDRMPRGGFGDACEQLELNFIAAGFFDDDLVAFGQTRQSQPLGQIGIHDCQLPLEQRQRGGYAVGAFER